MRPKYIAGPINSRLKARFMPHMGKRVPFGTVIIASTYLNTSMKERANYNSQNERGIKQDMFEEKQLYLVFLSRGLTSCVGAS